MSLIKRLKDKFKYYKLKLKNMRILKRLLTPIVKLVFLVNSVSVKIITFIFVKLLGKKKK